MPEITYPTIGHGQINGYYFPIKQVAACTYIDAQLDRLQNLGLGAFELALRKINELGRNVAIVEQPSPTVDKPATIEWKDYADMRIWNLLAGKDPAGVAAIDQDDFKAGSSEGCLLVHKLDADLANVIESHLIWRTVVDSIGISNPNSKEEDVRDSVRLTGEHWIMSGNAAAKIEVELLTAAGSLLTPSQNAVVERDDWPDDDDGSAVTEDLGSDAASGQKICLVASTTGFSAGQLVMIYNDADNWEIAKIASLVADVSLTMQDDLENSYTTAGNDLVKRTRGVTFFVHNSTTTGGAWLTAGDDYLPYCTNGNTKIKNVDGGSGIGATDKCYISFAVASAAEEWTDNDTDLSAVQDPQTTLVVDTTTPDATFSDTVEIRRAQGYDISVTFNRSAFYESGNEVAVERSFDEVDVRLTIPGLESDITTLARLGGKDPATVKTMRPEQSAERDVRMEIYTNSNKFAGDIEICYELCNVKRSSAEMTSSADERSTKRVTLTGDKFTVVPTL